MEDRLDLLEGLCRGLRNEIQSPHDNRVEDALFLILQELRYLRDEIKRLDERK